MAGFFIECTIIKSDKFIVKLTFFLLCAEIIKMSIFLTYRFSRLQNLVIHWSIGKGESNDNG